MIFLRTGYLALTLRLEQDVTAHFDAFENGMAAARLGDYAAASALWRPLAEQGDSALQNILGVMYAEGRGVSQDYPEAVKWYRKAAKQGDADAQYSLGITYVNGQGVPQDDAAAAKWWRKAAEQGNADAQVGLGLLYAQGIGVSQDIVQAHMWFNIAAAQSHKMALEARGRLDRVMTPTQIVEAKRVTREWEAKRVVSELLETHQL
jgi:tetratricopeptide (TPR) repeat protein